MGAADFPIPPADPQALPLPPGVLKVLLLLCFGLHILAVDLGVGGSVVCLYLAIRGRTSDAHKKLALALAPVLPPAVTFAITLGVAPLLFVQLLYGRFLYTSSVLMALPWMSFLIALIIGYGLLYRHTHLLKEGRFALPTALGSAVLLLWIGFLWTNNVTLMLQPDRWGQFAASAPHGGMLNLADPTVLPRFLHMMLAMTAMASIFLGTAAAFLDGEHGFDKDLARRFGLRAFAFLTMAQLAVGPVTLFLQRGPVRSQLLGGRALVALIIAVPSAIAAIAMALRGADPRSGKKGALIPFILIHLTVAGMILLRDEVRDRSLAEVGFHVEETPFAFDAVAVFAFLGAIAIFVMSLRWIYGWLSAGRGQAHDSNRRLRNQHRSK